MAFYCGTSATRSTENPSVREPESEDWSVGQFDLRTSTQLRHLAVTENRSIQALLEEAIDLLFQARGLAPRDE